MRIEIWHIGKTKAKWIADGEKYFLDKCRNYGKIEVDYLKSASTDQIPQIKREESINIHKRLEREKKGYTILLDERGRTIDSVGFAKHLGLLAVHGKTPIRFITGGAYGVDDSIRQTVDEVISVSPMIVTHELIRIILLEQLYRAFTILRGESYHHI